MRHTSLRMSARSWLLAVMAVGMAAATSGCGDDSGGDMEGCEPAVLDQAYLWYGENRAALNDFMDEYKVCPDDEVSDAPIAVFDFDNTVITGDIGDGSLFELLNNDMVHRPPSWQATSRHLTPEAIASLDLYCPLESIADPLPTSSNPDCLTAMLCIYREGALWNGMQTEADTGTLCTGAAAWVLSGDATPDTIEPAYAWAVSLQAGYTPDEIGVVARAAFDRLLAGELGSSLTMGYLDDIDGYIRLNEQLHDLMSAMQANGFDVWISSATAHFVVSALAPDHVGIAADHVIGAQQSVGEDGLLTYDFPGCGRYADETQELMNYREGKRCWINKVIFGMADGPDQQSQASPIVFGAGDSDTDSFFVRDATGKRLMLNRNKGEIMCYAYANTDGKWLVNPMFYLPRAQKESGYDCSAYSLPDQEDTVYCSDGIYDSEHCSAPLQ